MSDTAHTHVWRKLCSAAVAVILIGVALSDPLIRTFPPGRMVTASYPGGVRFVGFRTPFTTTRFTTVQAGEDDETTRIQGSCPLLFHWQGHTLEVGNLSAGTLDGIGVSVSPCDYSPARSFGSISGADADNRDYGVEFSFRKDIPVHFLARYSKESKVQCPFLLSFRGGRPVRFPLTERQLEEAFGKWERITVTPYL